jgi:thiol:disulfide interchange protein DsbD
MMGRLVGLCTLLLHLCSVSAADAVVQTPQTRVELSAERHVVAPGDSLWVALSIHLKPKWHTYWRTPGDAGEPINIKWNLPAGVVAGPIQWPTPDRFSFSGIAGFGYTRHVTLLTELKIAGSVAAPADILLHADGTWLICAEICIPEDGSFSLPLRIEPVHRNMAANPAFVAARRAIPRPAPWPVRATTSGNTLIITAGPGVTAETLKSVLYFPYDGDLIVNGAAQDVHLEHGTLELRVEMTSDASGRGEADGVLRFDQRNNPVPAGYAFAAPISRDMGVTYPSAVIHMP